jgi:hypothetical protein
MSWICKISEQSLVGVLQVSGLALDHPAEESESQPEA